MKHLLMAAAVAAVAASPALAQQPTSGAARAVPVSMSSAAPATGAQGRPVLVCEDDAHTRSEFARIYGEVRFVTVESIQMAAAAGETWSTPRCITEVELQRYRLELDARQVSLAGR